MLTHFDFYSTKYSKANCTTQYNSAMECMRESVAGGSSEAGCANAIEQFANCRQ